MAESNKIFCEPCEHDGILIDATIWCNDCCEGFCEECIKGHKSTKILRNHHIITISEHLETSDLNVSQTCAQHSKPFDSFCPQHDELLCLKCIQLHHGKCEDLLRIDEAVKGVKTSTALTDLDEQITTLLLNIAKGLELNTENKKSVGDQKEAIKSTINDIRARINVKLDQLQKKLLDELETKYGKSVLDLDELKDRLTNNEKNVLDMQTQLNRLKTHASDMQNFIGMKTVGKAVFSEKDDVEKNMKNIRPDLELRVNSSTNSLIGDLKEFGEIVLQNQCEYATYLEPHNRQAQLDVVQVFDLTTVRLEKRLHLNLQKGENPFSIKDCVKLGTGNMVFTDCKNKRLIIHDENGIYKKDVLLSANPKNITLAGKDEVAISYTRAAKYFDVIYFAPKKLNRTFSCSSINWHKAVCFHDGKFYIAVVNEGIKVTTKDGVLIKTFLTQIDNISKIGAHNNHFFYSRNSDNTLYCTDFEEKLIWKFGDHRFYRKGYTPPFAIDGHGNVYVISYTYSILFGISFDGKHHAVLLTESDGLDCPSAIFCDQQNNRILVCNEKDGRAFVFDIKN